MRGQWINYDSFNLVDLIDELKTRITEPHRVDDILHGMLIVKNNYYDLSELLRNFLIEDDKKGTTIK